MATTVGLFGQSGEGKTTSIVINPDGTYNPTDYQGMSPKETVIINSDRKSLPFMTKDQWVIGQNVFIESDANKIKTLLGQINGVPQIKAVYIDTVNGIMLDKEMNDIRKKTYDKWADLAQEVYDLISFCNVDLRPDLIVYLSGHVSLFTDVDGNESKGLVTNGRKLEKIKLESKLPIVLFTAVRREVSGQSTYKFQTQANRSTAKSPIGMFKDFEIPNSLKLVDTNIREYYGL